MKKTLRAWLCLMAMLLLPFSTAHAATLGPVSSYEALTEAVAAAEDGDTILIEGIIECPADTALAPGASLRFTSNTQPPATVRALRLRDASASFSHIYLADSLVIIGSSHVELGQGVVVSGAHGASGVNFSGSGALIVDRQAQITGGEGASGVSISHSGGEFYGSIDGHIRGGDGEAGGPGVNISPLGDAGALMISGTIEGGDGSSLGGHALNLYDLSGNAYVTVDGSLTGGSGSVGGDGIQLVAAKDTVTVGISGSVKGGDGEAFGGDALILMNAEGSSAFNLSGALIGGNATQANAQPGSSLLIVGDSTARHAYVNDCVLENGHVLANLTPSPEPTATPEPAVTPLPQITSSVDEYELMITPEPTVTPETTPSPSVSPTAEPTATPQVGEIATPAEATPAEAFVQG